MLQLHLRAGKPACSRPSTWQALVRPAKGLATAFSTRCLLPGRPDPQAGIERKAASRNLFIKLLSLTEARALLSVEAAAKVDLCKIFGVTPRDVLTLRSGYSAEGEGEEAEQ